jgi:DNA polymerase III subunit beta
MSDFEIKLPKLDLTALLSRAGGCSNVRSPLPIMSCVLLQASDGTLTASSTDSIVSERSSAGAKVKMPGALCVDAKKFAEQVKALPVGEVTLKRKDSALTVSCGGSRFKLPCQDSENFPELPVVDGAKPLAKVDAKVLARLIAQGAYAVSLNETLPHLTCAYVEMTATSIAVVSTDGSRLGLAEAPLTESVACKLALPAKGIAEVRKLCGSTEGDVEMYRSGSMLLLKSGDTVLSVLTGDEGSCPPYRKVIPKDHAHRVCMQRDALISAVKRVGLVGQAIEGCGIRLDFVTGALSLTATAKDSDSEAQDRLECDSTFELAIGTNCRFLEHALSVLESDAVTLDFSGPLDPIVIKAADGGASTNVIMPMRLA